ncbi:MAG: ATP-grasp domain-containing protein [Cyanobacteria bacterium J06600_6]
MIFLFPNDCFDPQKPDAVYRDRYLAFKQAGFQTALIEIESLDSPNASIYPASLAQDLIVYLGWMLSAENYRLLTKIIHGAGATPFTSNEEYLATHYLPNWYPLIQDLTPETRIYAANEDLVAKLAQLNWSRYFIKDYVKSLKTSVGAIIDRPEQINIVLAEMKKYRGVIEGGVCVRRVEDFLPKTEQRYFVINHQPFAADLDLDIPQLVQECATRIESNFFSVDVIQRADGALRIVEIGDGQVSDLVGWSVDRTIQIWQNAIGS